MIIPSPPAVDLRRKARAMYWQGWRCSDIANWLGLPHSTVRAWKTRDGWDDTPVIARVETSLEARLMQLVSKEPKTGSDYKEIDLIGRQIERFARVRRYQQPGGHEGDLNPAVQRRAEAPRRRPLRNEFSEQQKERLIALFDDQLFGYQRRWRDVGRQQRIRNILKSRQIGATFYFAREALVDALETGRNQIFLSASKAQAHVFKQYITAFAREVDVELKGDPIVLPNEATLYFLGTNARTAQSYHGNLYFDEYFWVHRFQELRKVASGMAIHKKWRQTYFSTPSSITHDAYPFWSGDLYNKGRRKDQRVEIDTSHQALAAGAACADGQWRQIVTVEDAVREGCDLFDLQQLRLEYSDDEWANLLMCQFIDDTLSVFPLAELQAKCFVDSWEAWEDFQPFAERPFGEREVWIGYDPAETGDTAGLVVVAPPAAPGGKFRVLEKKQWRGLDFAEQAAYVRDLCRRYHVGYIGIDTGSVGAGVYQLVRQFFPAAESISYSLEVKTRMVLKAKDVISSGRLEFDAGWTDLAHALISIRKTMTDSGRHVTFRSGRDDDGHADLAWALLHALAHEPIEGRDGARSNILEIF
ncbi:terminase large subunit domain-containing protein [Thermomonas hydrothermalis]|uniref:terminase large subunit domain-containing protein n=1 Tax=Thermomonas hydrothermalis TaxID=213588 RepID=UPI002357913B|nr:terminase family protein [Thermomonas hydrothermalis]